MNITSDFLRKEVEAMEVRHQQLVADLQIANGALQMLTQLLDYSERQEVAPPLAAVPSDAAPTEG